MPRKQETEQFEERPVIHIVDDDSGFRRAVSELLEAEGYLTRPYHSADQFISTYEPAQLECTLLDLSMPGMQGMELLCELRRRRLVLLLIVISAHGTTPDVVQAIRSGAIDFLEKPVESSLVISTVRQVLSHARSTKRLRKRRSQLLWQLSEREREVLDLFMEAKTTVRIAKELNISPKTVEKHRARVFEKTGVESIPALMRLFLWHE